MLLQYRNAAGQRFVVKRALQESSKHKRNLKEAHAHAHAAAISLLAAEQFQQSIKGAGLPGLSLASFGYVPASVVILEDKEAPSECAAVVWNADLLSLTLEELPGLGQLLLQTSNVQVDLGASETQQSCPHGWCGP